MIKKRMYGIDCIIRHDYSGENLLKIRKYQDESIKAFSRFIQNIPYEYKSVLDLGCYDNYCLSKFEFEKKYGLDLYLTYYDGDEKTKDDLIVEDWYEMDKNEKLPLYIDAIFCNHSLEHADNVYKLMYQISKKQKKGGALFIAVPDGNTQFGYSLLQSTTHFSCLTEGFLRTLLNRFGYTTEIEIKELRKGCKEIWAYGIKMINGWDE